MALFMVVHRYFQRSTKCALTCLGLQTIMEAKIPKQAEMSDLVRVVSRIIDQYGLNMLPTDYHGIILSL